MRRIAICGYKQSGKSVLMANLMRQLPPDSFYLAFAAPDGEWHWTNFGDQDLVAVVRQKGKFSEDFVSSMVEAIRFNEQPLVLVDTGGVMSPENERIFAVCDGCIILVDRNKYPNGIAEWREFATRNGVTPVAELESDLHGSCELYADRGDGIVRGQIAGLNRGATVQSPTLNAVVDRLREIIRSNADMTEGEMLCNINGATLVTRLDVADRNDPFLGVRPLHLRSALRLTAAVAKLETVRIWNVRAAILASAYAARLPSAVELYDVSKGYVRVPEVTPQGAGNGNVAWEILELPEYTLVKFKPTCFITAEMLKGVTPPVIDTEKPVVLAHDGPPMWLDATIVRAYARAGAPWVAMLWPVESGRAQPSLDGRKWSEVHPFAGPVVVVAGPDEKIGEMFPISFDLLRWGTPILGTLASSEPVIDRKDSHAASHGTALPLLAEAFSHVHASGRAEFCEEVDFGRNIGETICVATESGDNIVFAQRPNRRGITRFVKNHEPEPTQKVTACFKRVSGGAYLLMTAFVGGRAPAEPWDRKWATAESFTFWNTHALLWGREETIPGTETTICPW
jgi:CRISPR-associated protein Csx3